MVRRLGAFWTRFRHHAILREFLGFGSTTLLNQLSRTGVSLLAAAHLGPITWGSWYLLNLIIRYGALTHMGALNGLNRQYPLELGRGRSNEALLLRQASLGLLVVSLGLSFSGAALAAFLFPALPLGGVILTAALLCSHQLYTYAVTALKAGTRFNDVSRLQLAAAVLQPIAVIPLLWAWGLNGFILGQALAYVLVVGVVVARERTLFRIEFDPTRWRTLVRIGFPIMLVGVLYALFSTVDRWVVTVYLGAEALGHYSLAIMALGAVSLMPMTLAQQFYPRMARAWGERRDWGRMRRLAIRQGWLAFGSTLPVVVGGWFAGPPLIRSLLPAYTPGIAPMLVALLSPLFLCFGQGYANVLNVTDHQYDYVALIVLSIAVNAVGSVLLVQVYGLLGVAIGTLIGFAVFSLGLVAAGQRVIRRARP